jgi:hypothetical protein
LNEKNYEWRMRKIKNLAVVAYYKALPHCISGRTELTAEVVTVISEFRVSR